MAQQISKNDIKELRVLAYESIRDSLKSGDLLFASGNYWASKAIRKVTDSPWSHVAIVFKIETLGRVLLLESVEDMGVRIAPLSKYLSDYERGKSYRGEIVIARVQGINKSTFDNLANYGIDELTKPYDKDEITKIIARIAIGRGKWKKDREYICSELVAECFEKSGKKFEFDKRGFISPENIWRDRKVSIINRIL